MKLVIVTSWFFLFLTFGSCSNEKQSNSELPSNVVKVVTTRTYTAKTEFDKLIKDQPAYHMGYGEMFEMDFGWNTKHFDKYGNTVYEEKFTLAKNGEENVHRKIYNKFFSAKDGRLEFVNSEDITFGTTVKAERRYLRGEGGRLEEVRITVKENLEEKHLFSYNNVGQRAQMEIYKVDGLAEKTTFTYNSASSTAKPIREIHEVFGDGSYREEFEYQKNEKNQLQKIRRRYFENGQLKSDLTTTYSNYIENTHTKEVTEGYDSTITGSDGIISGSTPFKRTITLTLNKSKDIVMYKSEINRPDTGQLRVKFQAMSLCTDLRASLVSFYYFSIVYRDIEPISSMRF